MAEGDCTVYTCVEDALLSGELDLASGGDSLIALLMDNHTPDTANDDAYSDFSADEYATGSGYTQKNKGITGQSVSNGDVDCDDITWSSLGPLSPATPSHCIIIDDTHTDDMPIVVIELGTTATNGQDYTIQINGSGLFGFS